MVKQHNGTILCFRLFGIEIVINRARPKGQRPSPETSQEPSTSLAIENERLFQAEREQRQMAEALADAVSAMSSTLNLEQVMETIAKGIVDKLGYDWVLSNRYTEEEHIFAGLALHPVPASEGLDQLLHLVGHPEWKQAPVQFRLPYQLGQNSLIDRVLEGETATSDSLADFLWPWVPRLASAAVQKLFGMQSFVDVPMRSKGKTVGTILAGVRQGPVTAAQQRAIVQVSDQAAIAIENAQLYERAQQEIEERLQAEEMLRRTNSNLEAMIENTDEYILICDADALPIRFNSAYAQVMKEMFGIDMKPGLQPHKLLPDPNVVAWWDDLHRRVLSGEKFRTEYRHTLDSGQELYLEILYSPIVENDRVVGFTEFTRDITERKQAEAALIKASLMDATATLAGGIAHRINNLMTGVMGNAELLMADFIDQSRAVRYQDAQETLATISQSAREASRLAQQTLAFARKGKVQPRSMNLNDTIRDVLRLQVQEQTLPVNIGIEHRLALDLWEIEADTTQMSQMFINLFVNAIEALEGVDRAPHRITVVTDNTVLDKAFCRQAKRVPPHPDIEPGPYVCLSLQDTGQGMSEHVLSRLFEPFFSTKFQGRGLGLAAAYGIVRNHGGHILVHSQEESGSTFEIYLPAKAG